jgi:transcription-repair coupling factor (superfamily II helicase)
MILPFFEQAIRKLEVHPSFASVALELERRVRQTAAGEPGNQVTLAGLTGTAKVLAAALLGRELGRPVLFVTSTNRRAEELAGPLRFFHQLLTGQEGESVALFPAHDVLPYRGLSPHPDISEARAVALWRLATDQVDIAVAPVRAAMGRLAEKDSYAQLARTLHKGDTVERDELIAHLESTGYARQEPVEMPGQYSVRGGLVDIFPPEGSAVRLEFFGDELEELRGFDPSTQRSTGPIREVVIVPMVEVRRTPELMARLWELREGAAPEGRVQEFPGWEFLLPQVMGLGGTILDLLPRAVVVFEEPDLLRREAETFWAKLEEDYESAREETASSVAPGELYWRWSAFESVLSGAPQLHLEQLPMEIADADHHILLAQPTPRFHGKAQAFAGELHDRLEKGMRVLVTAANQGEMERMAELLTEFEVPFRFGMPGQYREGRVGAQGKFSGGQEGAVVLLRGPIGEGVVFPEAGLALYGNHDLFDTVTAVRAPVRAKPRAAVFASDSSDIQPGDFVVHLDHGIGRFTGMEQIEQDGRVEEFLQILYQDNDRLYVPLVRLDLVQRYRGLGDVKPKLDRLGGVTWQRTHARTAKVIREMADELVKLYARRAALPGHGFAVDTPWQGEFEDAFEWEETPDQDTVIREVKDDMERSRPMDRLLVGDVGFGKTEVALRAAFKAVCDNKQVAVLAPTTVLAFQHFRNLQQRLAAFPVKVEMLSRLRTRGQQKKILEAVETGALDVIVGTHRLLSQDVRFHDLGLLVVDEEQRFGVRAKERLKQLKTSVDALTLTATPIPRTLHMAVVGLRDMSLIQTPPRDRLAIQTVVAKNEDALVKSALERELARGGQVYFVHDRIDSIYEVAARVKRLAPEATIGVAHGRLKETELERVVLGFMRKEFDVLVTTKIIENGLDISLANTIIINRADRFGLAELYQLRGRVGRSDRRAYAYLLISSTGALSDTARKRLAALKEFSELGAGFRLAALDLELRGAGNLLGAKQHGHVNAVGFDLYTRMLEQAVSDVKGEETIPEARVTLNLGVDLRIPSEYIQDERQRLRMYKKIASLGASEEDREALTQELEDRFGPPPRAVENLLEYAGIKAAAEKLRIESVERRQEMVRVRFHPRTPVSPPRLVEFVRSVEGAGMEPSGTLHFPLRRKSGLRWLAELRKRLLTLRG